MRIKRGYVKDLLHTPDYFSVNPAFIRIKPGYVNYYRADDMMALRISVLKSF